MKNDRILLFLILFSTIIFSTKLNGQTFRLGAITGLNISTQNESGSPEYGGYNFGGRVAVDLHEQFRTSLDLLYIRKTNSEFEDIQLNYVEVPFMVSFMDWMDDPNEEEYYKLHFTAGVSIGKLLNFNAINHLDEDVTEQQSFNKTTVNLIGGLVYYLNEHLGVNLQYSHSFSNVQKREHSNKLRLKNWSLSFIYMFDNKRR